ncbi:MAG TPA: SRPBCC domain-containing protein [Thermoanaerobaculia bacterium]|nr:SRPBCC domain-containing protein [Thermoanaerobaculia bacterium]
MAEAIRQGDIPGVQLRRRQALAVSAEEAWRWLSEPDRLALWLAAEAEMAEGELALTGEGYRERGRTIEIVPPKLWVLAFERLDSGWTSATRLALRVHPLASGSEVDVLQDGFQRLPLSACLTIWETYRRRWRDALSKLAEIAVPIS